MGARAEAGRTLAEVKVLARVLQSGNSQLVRDAANGLRADAQRLADGFAKLPPDPVERYRWLQAQAKPALTDRARSYYYANILSGIKTHERNAIGNASNALVNLAAQPFGAAADAIRSAVTGKPREVLFSELPPQAAGALVGIPQGIREALFTLKNGVTRAQLSGAMSAAEAGKLDLPSVEFAGGGANPFNWPARALDAADQAFRAVAKHQELYALAFRQAKREGLSGARLQDRIAQLTAGTDNVSQALQQQADAFARHAVFQEQPGKFATGLQVLAKQYPAMSFVVPFIKTPANIIRQGFEFSPAGFAMKTARGGGREGAQALGKAAAGSLGVAYLAYLAATGRLSGSGPTNSADRAQLMESGWRPDSIRIGDRWVSYQPIQPLNTPASVVANAFESWRRGGSNVSDLDRLQSTVMGTLRSQLNQSFLSGVADLIDAIESGDTLSGRAANVAGRTAGSFVPFASALRSVQQCTDASVRRPSGVAETIKAGLPRLSQQVPARLDRFGRDVHREGNAVTRATDAFNISTESSDPVLKEIGRLQVRVGFPQNRLAGVDLTTEERRAVQVLKGQATYAALQRLIVLPQYQRLDDARKVKAVERLIQRARALAGKQATAAAFRGTLGQTGEGVQ